MPLFRVRNVESARLAIWKTTESPEELVANYPMLSLVYDEVCQRFKSLRRRQEFLAVRALLVEMSDGRLPIVTYDDNGKPLLDDGRKVSISHTHGYAAVLLSENDEVGVDIEQRTDRVAKVARLFVRDDEYCLQDGQPSSVAEGNDLPLDALLVIWSAKEAVYNLFSAQKLAFMEMKVEPFSPQRKGMIKVENLKSNVAVKVEYELTDDYVLTLCVLPE